MHRDPWPWRDATPTAARPSCATTRRARVLSRQRRDSELYVTPWDPGRARQKVGVPRALWREAQVGDALEVDTHPGALGWTWASGVRRLP